MPIRRFGPLVVLCLLASVAAGPATPPSPRPQSQQKPQSQARPARPAVIDLAARKQIAAGRELIESHPARALDHFEQASGLSKISGDLGAQAMAYDGRGSVALFQGRLQDALHEYQNALGLWPSLAEPSEQALTTCNFGQLLLVIGLSEDALELYKQALKLSRIEDRPKVRIQVYDGLGLAYHDLGKLHFALMAYDEGFKLARSPEDRARTYNRRGNVFRDLGELDLAYRELRAANGLAQKAGVLRWQAFSLADLAHLADIQGNDEEGLRQFDEALRLLLATSSPEPLAQASMLFGRAEVLRDLGRLDEARTTLKRSIEAMESARQSLDDPGARVGFFSFRQRYYDLDTTLLMDRFRRDRSARNAVAAFETSEISHSRSLLDDISGEPTAETPRLEDIQSRLLDDDTTLLSYSLGDRGSYLWLVNQDRFEAYDLGHRADIEPLARRAWAHLSGKEGGAQSDVESLARLLLPARAEPLLRKRLLIRPDGALHFIPFGALPLNDGTLLIEQHIVSSLPSASYIVGMRRKLAGRRPAPKQLAVLADAVYGLTDGRLSGIQTSEAAQSRGVGGALDPGRLRRLKDTEVEARAILKFVLPADGFEALGFDANRDLVMSQLLSQYQMVHFATHHVATDHPDFSGLVLSRYDRNGSLREGLLRASEIYQLKFPAELVVLSACGSGLGAQVRGEGPMGMTRAFLHAGARRVVVSLWDVRDDLTTELMARFYHQMLKVGLPPAEALREAQLSMIHDASPQFRRPSSWAAFVLQGEPR